MRWDELKCAEVEAVKLSPKIRQIANAFYLEMLSNHKGKENMICARDLAKKLSDGLNIKVTEKHIWRAGYLCRMRLVIPGLVSCAKGMYVDDSYKAMIDNLHFLVNGWKAQAGIIYQVSNIIKDRYGEDAIPEDIGEFLKQVEGIEDDDEEDNY